MVDIIAINDDGNLLDVAGLAGLIAVGNARMPGYNAETGKIEQVLTDKKIPLNKEALSFNMTFHKVGDHIVADVTAEEEAMSGMRWSISMGEAQGNPRISAMQKGKKGVITSKDFDAVLELAEATWRKQFPLVKSLVFGE